MDGGVVPPCLELGDEPEHMLLTWAGKRASKDGMIRLGQDRLFYRAERDTGAGAESFQHLEDAGYVEKIRTGESFRYRVLIFCDCKGGNPPNGGTASAREYSLRLTTQGSWTANGLTVGGFSGEMEESAQKPVTTVSLAKYFFPQVVRSAGIQMNPLQTNSHALAHQLNQWKLQGVDLGVMQLMMEEFVRHPEWCRRSRKPPWQVFIGMRGELASIVAFRKRKDPVRRRWSDGTWLTSHTPRAISPA